MVEVVYRKGVAGTVWTLKTEYGVNKKQMSKYNIYATREDWNKLYDVVERKLGKSEVAKYKKLQNMDSAITLYGCETRDYKLADLK